MNNLPTLEQALGGKISKVEIPPNLVWDIKFNNGGKEEEKDLSWIIENSANQKATASWYLEYLKDNGVDIDDSKKIFPLKVAGTSWKVKFWRSKSTGELVRVSLYEEDFE